MDKEGLPLCDACKGFISSQRTILSCFLFSSPRETDTCSHAHTRRGTHTLTADPNEVPKYGEQKVCRGVKGEAEQKTNK